MRITKHLVSNPYNQLCHKGKNMPPVKSCQTMVCQSREGALFVNFKSPEFSKLCFLECSQMYVLIQWFLPTLYYRVSVRTIYWAQVYLLISEKARCIKVRGLCVGVAILMDKPLHLG